MEQTKRAAMAKALVAIVVWGGSATLAGGGGHPARRLAGQPANWLISLRLGDRRR